MRLKGKKAIRHTWIASGSTVVVMPRNFAISAKSAKNTQMYLIKTDIRSNIYTTISYNFSRSNLNKHSQGLPDYTNE